MKEILRLVSRCPDEPTVTAIEMLLQISFILIRSLWSSDSVLDSRFSIFNLVALLRTPRTTRPSRYYCVIVILGTRGLCEWPDPHLLTNRVHRPPTDHHRRQASPESTNQSLAKGGFTTRLLCPLLIRENIIISVPLFFLRLFLPSHCTRCVMVLIKPYASNGSIRLSSFTL